MNQLKSVFKLARINSWVKNLFIFLPIFFSGSFFDSDIIVRTSLIFIGFSFAASFIYIINDINDINYDKSHPTKKYRPIASGKIGVQKALILGILMLLISVSILFFTSKIALYLTLFYVILNMFYSLSLKHIPIIDFIVISFGFVIRILIGGYANGIELSQWIIIMVFLLSVFIAVSKRRDDILQFEEEQRINRKVVEHYNLEFVDKVISIISSVLIVSYLLYITSPEVIDRYHIEFLLITFLLVVIGVIRYNYITYFFKKSGSPIKILFKDNFLKVVLILWLLTYFVTIYFQINL